MTQISMISDVLATIHTEYSGVVTVGENGDFVVDSRDGPTMITAGAMYVTPTQAEREAQRKERIEAKAKEDEEFAKSSLEDSKREALAGMLAAGMSPPPEILPTAPVPAASTPQRQTGPERSS